MTAAAAVTGDGTPGPVKNRRLASGDDRLNPLDILGTETAALFAALHRDL
jgi:hypothetical protein